MPDASYFFSQITALRNIAPLLCFAVMQGAMTTVPAHAQGLSEALITVNLSADKQQTGVYSHKQGSPAPTHLAVLLPGSPSVVRPVVTDGVMVQSKLTGNFLIRARRFLVDEVVATLIADCPSDSGDTCSSSYQASPQRQQDIAQLIAETKRQNPTIKTVWLVGTSMGTISSSFMAMHKPADYAGVIHTASITEPYARNSYRELADFDYSKSSTPQFLIHHANDPCHLTSYTGAKTIAKKFNVPLITVTGGSDFQGNPCQAMTEHGFKGKEKEVMRAIAHLIKTGAVQALNIE